MSKKDEFKKFILNKPELIDYVQSNKTTWQKLYELYDLYGEDNSVWDKYKVSKVIPNEIDLKGIISTLKKINLDSLEENISSIQKVVGLVEEFTKKEDTKPEVKPKEEKIEELYGDKDES